MFRLNNKIHFSLANANSSASFKRKMFKNHRFCSFTTTNQLVNEAANDSARVSGQDRKKRPALGTNQIAGFKGFRPLANLEKNKIIYHFGSGIYYIHTYLLLAEFSVRIVNYGPSFFPSIYGPSAKRAGHKSMEIEKNQDP